MLETHENHTALEPQIFSVGKAPDGLPYQIVCLQNQQGMCVQLMDWGATWLSCQIPVNGNLREVLLGCQPEDYPKQTAYLGASIGRYANRIANAKYGEFDLAEAEYGVHHCVNFTELPQRQLVANQGKHQLHGGEQGFDKVRWKLDQIGKDFVRYRHFSPDGDQGFAGDLLVFVTYQLSQDNALIVTYEADNTEDTPLNLTNHAYFNLMDAEQGCDVRSHFLQVKAQQFLPVNHEGIPNTGLKSVKNTSFNFLQEKTLQQDFLKEEQQLTKGYDHSFLLDKSQKTAAILTAPDRSLRLEISTSQAAIQVYTGNYLHNTPNRQGNVYENYQGIALETQALPDTPNHPEWWQFGGMSKAKEGYEHWTKFKFIIENEK